MISDKQPCVYILSSSNKNTVYIGVTSCLPKRIWQHKNGFVEGFTQRYRVHYLVYYEVHDNMESAIVREKQLKRWKRAWKNKLISSFNRGWLDLSSSI
ncbi:MAG: GIY-YIG nuclease family protein [Vibrio sp.]|uniref:GIY-YIG nuclease family protein n=1 Tax=Vibrio sp. TaxID=678 RepID=UPI003A888970